jgi:hypothetical protein
MNRREVFEQRINCEVVKNEKIGEKETEAWDMSSRTG